jgi:tetratricopeptide (TPR) repeat protein
MAILLFRRDLEVRHRTSNPQTENLVPPPVRLDADVQYQALDPEAERLVQRGDRLMGSLEPSRLNTALQWYEKAVELDRAYVPAYIGLCHVRTMQNDGRPETLANFRSSVKQLEKVAPELCETWYKRAILSYGDHQYAAGLEQARRAVSLPAASKKGRAAAHCVYGWSLINAGKTHEALTQYEIAATLWPDEPDIERHVSDPYRVWGHFEAALAHNQRSIDLEPHQTAAYFERAMIYQDMGDYSYAIDFFEKGQINESQDAGKVREHWDQVRQAFQLGGEPGYWQKRLDNALNGSTCDTSGIALILAHLGRIDEAYDWLEKSCDDGTLDNLWAHRIWDRSNPRFEAVAKKVGLDVTAQ